MDKFDKNFLDHIKSKSMVENNPKLTLSTPKSSLGRTDTQDLASFKNKSKFRLFKEKGKILA